MTLTSEQWGALPPSKIAQPLPGVLVYKCANFCDGDCKTRRVGSKVAKLSIHETAAGRLLGYTLDHKAPRVLDMDRFVHLVFSSVELSEPVRIVYQDQVLRLLSFGDGPDTDFMLVVRSKAQA